MKKVMLFILLSLALLPAAAQKKELREAKDWVKSGKNLDKAEKSMTELLKDSDNREKEKIWRVLFDALLKQYEQGNEKLYLKQKYDTARLFNTASRMFTVMQAYDSIDARPDERHRVKPKMRKQNSELLNKLRPNLYNGGVFFINKRDYAHAYHLLSQYIDAAVQPMFRHYHYDTRDPRMPQAAYWAAYCGYKLNDADKVLHNTYLALKDTAHHESMLQYLSAAYMLDGDTARCVQALKEGFRLYPLSAYFYPHLIEHYSKAGAWTEALALTDSALKADSANAEFLVTKSTLLLNIGNYDESYAISHALTQQDDCPAEAWLNAGLSKFNKGVELDKNVQRSARTRNTIFKLYREARPYLEKYRVLKPDNKDRWALPLYTIYLNLNMGKQFDEIDKILSQ